MNSNTNFEKQVLQPELSPVLENRIRELDAAMANVAIAATVEV